MPSLNWIGKDKVLTHHLDVPFKVLDTQYDFHVNIGERAGSSDSHNMIIHGDNLEALKALLPYYENKVDCIYIDPPYNTGNENWVYNDNVNDPHIAKWLGEVVGNEGEDLCRHDKWLCMMYPRLVLLRELLSEDGVIFISIDDNELTNLKCICDEIFGIRNFVTIFSWVRKKKGSFLSSTVRRMTEYVVCYQKNSGIKLSFFGEKAYSDKWQPIVKRTNGVRVLKFPANLISTKLDDGHYDSGFRGKEGTGMNFLTPFDVKDGIIISEISVEGHFTWQQSFLDNEINNGSSIDLSRQFGFNVLRYNQDDKIKAPSTLITIENGVGTNEDATAELQDMFGGQPNNVFQYSKPKSLIEYLIRMVTYNKSNAIILDAFAGSGTTGHAVLNINKSDNKNHQFVLVEMGDYADSLTCQRIKTAINGYDSISGHIDGLSGDFAYFELGNRIFYDNGNLNECVGEEKIREYIYYSETRQPLLREQSPSAKYYLDSFNRVGYYFYYEPEKETVLSLDTLNIIVHRDESYVVYADICTIPDSYLQKHNIVFKQIPRDIKHF